MATTADLPLRIVSENSTSERRITPSWTITQLKSRLEPITGVPAFCQKLRLRLGPTSPQLIESHDENTTQIGSWPLQPYAEIEVGT